MVILVDDKISNIEIDKALRSQSYVSCIEDVLERYKTGIDIDNTPKALELALGLLKNQLTVEEIDKIEECFSKHFYMVGGSPESLISITEKLIKLKELANEYSK